MTEERTVSTRRRLLARMGVVLGGGATAALTMGAGEAEAHGRHSPHDCGNDDGDGSGAGTGSGSGSGSGSTTRTLSLVGSDWHARPVTTPGSLPVPGSPTTTVGNLALPDGTPDGVFNSYPLAGDVALHRFDLNDGTLYGLGPADADNEAVRAITGGTLAYARATGTYLAVQNPIETGGDGTASFTITLSLPA